MIQWDSTFATGFFILYRGEHMNNGKGRFDRKVFAVFVVLLMLASNPIIIMEGSEESDAALPSGTLPSYTYTLNLSNMSLSVDGMSPISRTDDNYTNTSFDAGSWTWNEKGYGPFNSFYALFDSNTGEMLGHLDPYDLSKYILPTEKKGQSAPITSNNVMWCIPTVYVTSTSTSITFSSENTPGSTSYAHMIGDTTYNYLAIGVYEGTNTISGSDTGKFLSVSGQSPQVSKMREAFRAEAIATPTPDSNVKGMLWNYHQWQLYRICALMTMESFDSQGVVGYGNANGSGKTTTGTMNAYGPYAGSSTSSSTTNLGAKLFIENAWGSVWEFVDDAVWYNGNLYVGHTGSPSDEYSNSSSDKYMSSDGLTGKTSIWSHSATSSISGYGGSVGTGNVSIWGFPTATGGSASSGTYDYMYIPASNDEYAQSLYVGGDWDYTGSAGVSYVHANALDTSRSSVGSRLSFVFDADPAATPTVTLDHSNLTAKGGVATGFATELPITDTATYPDLNTITSNPSIQAGWTHIGWEVNGEEYKIGASLASTESHTAKSLWAEPKMIIMDHSALSSLGGPVTDLPSTEKIDDATTTYPDLNSAEYAFYVLGFRHTGWYDEEGNFYAIGSPVIQTTSHTVKSAWIVPQITITFMVEGEEYSTLQVPKGSVGVVYTPLMVEGVFEGWYYDAGLTKKYQADKALNDNTTLYAKGVPPLEFTSIPTASATITKVNPYGLFFFDATDSTGKYQIEWDFGDGNTSTDAIAYNTYVEPGVYKVTLKITNLYGDVATETFDVIYGDQPDSADGPVRGIMSVLVVALVLIVVAGVLIRRVL